AIRVEEGAVDRVTVGVLERAGSYGVVAGDVSRFGELHTAGLQRACVVEDHDGAVDNAALAGSWPPAQVSVSGFDVALDDRNGAGRRRVVDGRADGFGRAIRVKEDVVERGEPAQAVAKLLLEWRQRVRDTDGAPRNRGHRRCC